MNRHNAVAWAFSLWAAVVTAAFLAFNGGHLWSKLLERLGGS